nr:FGGY-family carbohydrate kinase [Endozoicomonas sp.]
SFLPYLSGERTPHNDPTAKGVLFGMTHSTGPAELALAVMEGVGFAFADGLDALHSTSPVPEEITLIGGGARSEYWRQMLSNIFGRKLVYRAGSDVGPALGAARLANLAMNPEADISDICPVPGLVQAHEPDMKEHARYEDKRGQFQQLYRDLKNSF